MNTLSKYLSDVINDFERKIRKMPFSLSSERIFTMFVSVIAMLTALPFHEYAHAWAANKMGDPTAKYQGRLTLNPFRHLDLFGSICMVLFGFGWAKPVPINPYNFKNPKAGMALSALAGPMSNIVYALVAMILYKILWYPAMMVDQSTFWGFFLYYIVQILWIIVSLNVGLAVFNLLPVPPLDGSRILNIILPERIYFKIMQYEQIIMFAIMALLFVGVLDKPLIYLRGLLVNGLDFLTGFVDIIARAILGV